MTFVNASFHFHGPHHESQQPMEAIDLIQSWGLFNDNAEVFNAKADKFSVNPQQVVQQDSVAEADEGGDNDHLQVSDLL